MPTSSQLQKRGSVVQKNQFDLIPAAGSTLKAIEEDQAVNWGYLANDFVVVSGDKKRSSYFLKKLHITKIEQERRLRWEIERKIRDNEVNLEVVLGKELAVKIRRVVL